MPQHKRDGNQVEVCNLRVPTLMCPRTLLGEINQGYVEPHGIGHNLWQFSNHDWTVPRAKAMKIVNRKHHRAENQTVGRKKPVA